MKRGLPIIADDGTFLRDMIVKGVGSAVRLIATGDPSQLLGCIKDGVTYAIKQGLQNNSSQAFKTGYWVDGFKTWVIVNKLKMSDIKLKAILTELKETKVDEDDVEILENIKSGLKSFEREILEKSNYWQIAYQWIKCLGDMIMTDTILFNDDMLK